MMLVRIRRRGKNLNGESLKPLWLACLLSEPLSLEEIWRVYRRRFGVDHWNRFAFAKATLDSTRIGHDRSESALERSHAAPDMAIMVGPPRGNGQSSALAEASTRLFFNSRTRGRFFRDDFSGDWHSRPRPETPWKIARLAERQKTHPSNSLSDRQKASF
jgi:hypothetical protein